MATSITFNGSTYSVPALGDTGWAAGPGNLSAYLVSIASGCLQTTGGTFTLSAQVDFGTTYGVKSAYILTETANPATTGILRLALTDTLCWGAGNLALSVSSSRLYFNGVELLISGDLPVAIVESREVYIAGTALNNYTGSLTVFNLVGSYVANGKNLTASVNGLIQDVTYDYAETGTQIVTFNANLNAGDRVSFRWATY